jgi:hypothetical protein
MQVWTYQLDGDCRKGSSPNFSRVQEQNIVIYGKGFGVGLTFLDEAGQTLTSIEHLDMHTKCITGNHLYQ